MIRTVNVGIAVLLAATVTFSLFFLMQFLIASDLSEPERGESIRMADITMPDVQLEIQRVEPKPPEIEEPEEIPDLPEQSVSLDILDGPGISLSRVTIDLDPLTTSVGLNASDAEYLPIVTVPPQYPTRALQRGIEGWCQVMFTVTENGSVIDAKVVDADPPNIFDRASLRAVARFKFNARTRDGEPVQTPGVQYLFTYNLAED